MISKRMHAKFMQTLYKNLITKSILGCQLTQSDQAVPNPVRPGSRTSSQNEAITHPVRPGSRTSSQTSSRTPSQTCQ